MRSLVFLFAFAAAAPCQTVLALPFFNHSNVQNLDWIGESIAESLGDSLAAEGVLTLDRSDRLEAYRRLSLKPGAELTHASIIKAGEALDASMVVFGTYDFKPAAAGGASKGSLRIAARVLDLKHTKMGPEFSEVGALEDVASLEWRLGWAALIQIDPRTRLTEEAFMKDRRPVRLDAVENYIRGLLSPSPEQQMRLFTQSARLDANYSQPSFQLGKAYWAKKDYKVAAGWLEKVNKTDRHYYEAQFFLGLCRYHGGEYAAAEKCFETVAAETPLNEVFNNLGVAQARQGKSALAMVNFAKAVEGDEADEDYRFNLGFTQWRAAKFDDAVVSLRAAVARNPEDAEATALLGRALKKDGARAADPRSENRERVKTEYEEAAYRQLQAELRK